MRSSFITANLSLSLSPPSKSKINSFYKVWRFGTNYVTTGRVNSIVGITNMTSVNKDVPYVNIATSTVGISEISICQVKRPVIDGTQLYVSLLKTSIGVVSPITWYSTTITRIAPSSSGIKITNLGLINSNLDIKSLMVSKTQLATGMTNSTHSLSNKKWKKALYKAIFDRHVAKSKLSRPVLVRKISP